MAKINFTVPFIVPAVYDSVVCGHELLIICGNATKENPLKMLRNMNNEIINGKFRQK